MLKKVKSGSKDPWELEVIPKEITTTTSHKFLFAKATVVEWIYQYQITPKTTRKSLEDASMRGK